MALLLQQGKKILPDRLRQYPGYSLVGELCYTSWGILGNQYLIPVSFSHLTKHKKPTINCFSPLSFTDSVVPTSRAVRGHKQLMGLFGSPWILWIQKSNASWDMWCQYPRRLEEEAESFFAQAKRIEAWVKWNKRKKNEWKPKNEKTLWRGLN